MEGGFFWGLVVFADWVILCRLWICLSGGVILFNKWVLHTAKFGMFLFSFSSFSFILREEGGGDFVQSECIVCALADAKKTEFPLFLTTWHMFFATVVTQCLAKFTTILDSRHKVPMNRETYTRAILPIGLFFSFSLICGNVAYLYLSVSFIQMLKV